MTARSSASVPLPCGCGQVADLTHRAALLLDGTVHRRDTPCYVQDERAERAPAIHAECHLDCEERGRDCDCAEDPLVTAPRTAVPGRTPSGHPLDCECDDCNEAAHNLPCTDCDCCASGDCAALFCSDCQCTSAVTAPARTPSSRDRSGAFVVSAPKELPVNFTPARATLRLQDEHGVVIALTATSESAWTLAVALAQVAGGLSDQLEAREAQEADQIEAREAQEADRRRGGAS